MTDVRITPHYFLRDGALFASKHTSSATTADGTRQQAEVLCMGELNSEGKAFWLEEMVRLI
jgi:hypothetical protein